MDAQIIGGLVGAGIGIVASVLVHGPRSACRKTTFTCGFTWVVIAASAFLGAGAASSLS